MTDATRRVAFRVLADGVCEIKLAEALESDVVPDAPDPPPPPTQDELDAAEARQYAKLQALRNMTPAEVGAWVDANVNNLADAKDALKTLAIAVCVSGTTIIRYNMKKVFGIQFIFSTEEAGLWWDSDWRESPVKATTCSTRRRSV